MSDIWKMIGTVTGPVDFSGFSKNPVYLYPTPPPSSPVMGFLFFVLVVVFIGAILYVTFLLQKMCPYCKVVNWKSATKCRACASDLSGVSGGIVVDYYNQILRSGKFSDEIRRCKYCAEQIKPEAVKCKHCGSDVGPYTEKQRSLHRQTANPVQRDDSEMDECPYCGTYNPEGASPCSICGR